MTLCQSVCYYSRSSNEKAGHIELGFGTESTLRLPPPLVLQGNKYYRPSQVLSTKFDGRGVDHRQFITLSVQLCLQYRGRDAQRYTRLRRRQLRLVFTGQR